MFHLFAIFSFLKMSLHWTQGDNAENPLLNVRVGKTACQTGRGSPGLALRPSVGPFPYPAANARQRGGMASARLAVQRGRPAGGVQVAQPDRAGGTPSLPERSFATRPRGRLFHDHADSWFASLKGTRSDQPEVLSAMRQDRDQCNRRIRARSRRCSPCNPTFRRPPGDPHGARLAIAVPVAQAVDDRTIRPVIALAGVDEMGELVM